jgi:hypothetical protein
VSALTRRLREIWIDQAGRWTTRGGRCALGERGEDAIHPFALQLAIDLHADRIFWIIHLSLYRGGHKSRRKRNDRKNEIDHANPPIS